MDYKKEEIREYFDDWINLQARNDVKIISNFKVIDTEKDPEHEYLKVLEYIHNECFVNVQYVRNEEEAKEWLGSVSNVFKLIRFIHTTERDSGWDGKNLTDCSSPMNIVQAYVQIIGEEMIEDWMHNPTHLKQH